MRILHVIRTLDPAWGGPVEGVRSLRGRAQARGWTVDILCVDNPSAPWLSPWGDGVHAVGTGILKYGFSRRLDAWLLLNAKSYDVIVVNGIWMYFSFAARKAARRLNVPYCVFIHGALDPWFKRHYPMKHIKKWFYWKLIERKVLRDARAVLFTTEDEKRLADHAFNPYSCNAQVVGYGIADPPPARITDKKSLVQEITRAYPSLAGRNFLLFLARIHEKKGIDLLLKAFAASKEAYSNVAMVIAGPGDRHTLEPLKKLASELRISDSVIWTGPLYGESKWRAIRAADAYILPSHQENFGISVVEALASGSPVLISDKVNIWREVEADGAGLVAPDDVDGTTSLLQRWAALSPERKTTMRQNARECFVANFDISASSSRFFELLGKMRSGGGVDPEALALKSRERLGNPGR